MNRPIGVEAREALDPPEVADLATEYYRRFVNDPEFDKFKTATKMYVDCWASYTGYPLVAKWNLDEDKGPLFVEGLRVICLKAAVYTLTNKDGKAAELPVSLPVDEMTHAMIAQPTLWVDMMIRTGVPIVHQTDLEEIAWEPGDFVSQCYRLAYGENPPERYWFGVAETMRRLAVLEERHDRAGIHKNGRSHDIEFELVAS
jgi:hypothetical protein